MLLAERETHIIAEVNASGSATVRELAELFGVTEVTIRRDLQRLEQKHLLKRTHGGALRTSPQTSASRDLARSRPAPKVQHSDALILAPVRHRAAHALKERAMRDKIPVIAESALQPGAHYLGPDNYLCGYALGVWTAEHTLQQGKLTVLDVGESTQANTKARSQGFQDGLAKRKGAIEVISVNGRGLFEESYYRASDALKLHPEINVIFGVNDDAVLGALQSYLDLGRDQARLHAVNIGGEGDTILNALSRGGALKATMALFPEVVGEGAVHAILKLWSGAAFTTKPTPHMLLEPHTLGNYYHFQEGHWLLKREQLPPPETPSKSSLQRAHHKRIAFVVQHPTHEWYQNLVRAMEQACARYGVHFEALDVEENFSAEIRELRRQIGKLAASYVNDGETIVLDSGSTTLSMARFLHDKRNLTVITNSLEVFKELQDAPHITLKLTGGEYLPHAQSLVGRGAKLLLNEVRADKAFLVAAGVSKSFGISSRHTEEAEVRRAMMQAAREVIVLADHSVLETDATTHVAPLKDVHTLITDAGVLPLHTLTMTRLGLKVVVAGRVSALTPTSKPTP